jgi:hypothetical protein
VAATSELQAKHAAAGELDPRRGRHMFGSAFFLTSFSENLAVERIWLWGESRYHYDYVWRKIKLFIGLRI